MSNHTTPSDDASFFRVRRSRLAARHARRMDGLAAARARGRVGGPKPKLRPRQVELARQMYDQVDERGHNRFTVAQIAAEFGVTRPTIYRYLDQAPSAGSP